MKSASKVFMVSLLFLTLFVSPLKGGLATTLTLTVDYLGVAYSAFIQETVSFVGYLKETVSGNPVNGETVILQKYVSGAWSTIISGSTNATGHVVLTNSESTNGTFQYRMYYAGSGTYDASTSSTQNVIADYTSTFYTPATIGCDYWCFDQLDSNNAPNKMGASYSQQYNSSLVWITTKETGNVVGLVKFIPSTVSIAGHWTLTGGTRGYPMCADDTYVYVPSADSGHLNVFNKDTETYNAYSIGGSGYPLGGVARDPSSGFIYSICTGILNVEQYMMVFYPGNQSWKKWEVTTEADGGQAGAFGFVHQGYYFVMFKKGTARILVYNIATNVTKSYDIGIPSDYATSFPNAWVFDGVRYAWMNHYNYNGYIYKIDLNDPENPVLAATYDVTEYSGDGLNGLVYFSSEGTPCLLWTSHSDPDHFFVWSIADDMEDSAVDFYVMQDPPDGGVGTIAYGGTAGEVYGARVVGGAFNATYARLKTAYISPPVPTPPPETVYMKSIMFFVGFFAFFLPLFLIVYQGRERDLKLLRLLQYVTTMMIGFGLLVGAGT